LSDARLNVFQRLARTWDAVHPYNAGQAFRLAGEFEPGRLEAAWHGALRAFDFQASVANVHELNEADDLDQHFTVALNRSFDPRDIAPFRPFANRSGGTTWLGITYGHRAADSVSVRWLLRDWIERVYGAGCGAVRRAAGPDRGATASFETFLALLRRYGEYRRSRKVHTMGPLDYPMRVRLLATPAVRVAGLVRYARLLGVKVNDVFTAALAEACDRFVPTQARPGRRHLAVSSIVDLRPALSPRDRDTFGCRLGFSSVICSPRHLRDWDRLLRAVASQNAHQRRSGFVPLSLAWMRAAELATSFTPPSRLYDFYRKEAPFAGGVSNVNLNDTWFGRQHAAGRVLDYVRVSPTGPMVPVVVNVTSLGDELRLSMTYRSNLFNDWTAQELGETFARRMVTIAS
jgi:hypothetical protein